MRTIDLVRRARLESLEPSGPIELLGGFTVLEDEGLVVASGPGELVVMNADASEARQFALPRGLRFYGLAGLSRRRLVGVTSDEVIVAEIGEANVEIVSRVSLPRVCRGDDPSLAAAEGRWTLSNWRGVCVSRPKGGARPVGVRGVIGGVAITRDGGWVALGGQHVELRDYATLKLRHKLGTDYVAPQCLAFSPDGGRLAVCDITTQSRLFDLRAARPTADELKPHHALCWSADGSCLAGLAWGVAGGASVLRFYDEAGRLVLEEYVEATHPLGGMTSRTGLCWAGASLVMGGSGGGRDGRVAAWRFDVSRPAQAAVPAPRGEVARETWLPDDGARLKFVRSVAFASSNMATFQQACVALDEIESEESRQRALGYVPALEGWYDHDRVAPHAWVVRLVAGETVAAWPFVRRVLVGPASPWSTHLLVGGPYKGAMVASPVAGKAALARLLSRQEFWQISIAAFFTKTFTAESAHLIAKTPFSKLETLSFVDELIGDEGAVALAESPHFGATTVLCLARAGLTGRAAEGIASSRNWPHLRVLNLSGNQIASDGASALAGPSRLESLEELHLHGNLVDDEGAVALAGRAWPRLVRLTLQKNPITERGIDALLSSPSFPRLFELELDERLVPYARTRLAADRPNLRLTRHK